MTEYTEEQKAIAPQYEGMVFTAMGSGDDAEYERVMAEFKAVKKQWDEQ